MDIDDSIEVPLMVPDYSSEEEDSAPLQKIRRKKLIKIGSRKKSFRLRRKPKSLWREKKRGVTFIPTKQKKDGRDFTAAIKSSTVENNVWLLSICATIPPIQMLYSTGLVMITTVMKYSPSLGLR